MPVRKPSTNPGAELVAQIHRWPENREELWEFVATIWGVEIPRVRVCPGHVAPFDAFADAFFAESDVAVWKASRGLGGKSKLLSTLAVTEMVCLKANVTVLGGSGEQSMNVHQYMSDAWSRPYAPKQLLTTDPTKRETRLLYGNKARALLASQTSVRGPHPERLRMDEVDEMDIDILKAALGQPISRNGIHSHTVLSSTHQYTNGSMTWALAEAKKKGWACFEWCWRESLAPNGWLAQEEVDRTRRRIPDAVWRNEYDLQEPSPEGRAFMTEAIEAMFDPALGVHRGEDNEYLEFEPPAPHTMYFTGADWAKESDWTIISTWREDPETNIWIRVAWERAGRKPWPAMVERLNARLRRYKGRCIHDITGVGNVVQDYIVIPPYAHVDGVWMQGKVRAELFSDYITRVENGGFRSPRIEYAYGEHKYAINLDIYGSGHPPDSVVADACAWSARSLHRSKAGLSAMTYDYARSTGEPDAFVDPRGV